MPQIGVSPTCRLGRSGTRCGQSRPHGCRLCHIDSPGASRLRAVGPNRFPDSLEIFFSIPLREKPCGPNRSVMGWLCLCLLRANGTTVKRLNSQSLYLDETDCHSLSSLKTIQIENSDKIFALRPKMDVPICSKWKKSRCVETFWCQTL